MRKKVSISDIAKEAGVSIATVSYVLNGMAREKRVSEPVAKRILSASERLEYQPSHLARSLRSGSTKTIGLVVADIANDFFGDLAKAIEVEAYKHGYSVIFASSDEDMDKSSMLTETLINRQVDGLIITPVSESHGQIERLSGQLPLVMVDRYLDNDDLNYVKLDNQAATFDAVSHLHQRGFKKIGIIGYKTSMLHIRDRFQGYVNGLTEYFSGSEPLIGEVRYDKIEQDISKTLDQFIEKKKVDALIFATNSLTIAGLYYCLKKNIRVPDQLAIIGFDGNFSFDFFYAPLTYIAQPVKEMGIAAVNILLKKMGQQVVSEQKEFQHKLIIREST